MLEFIAQKFRLYDANTDTHVPVDALRGIESGEGGTLEGVVTPQMYGAKGDGVTDDTAALQAAMQNESVLIPAGTYMVSATLDCKAHLLGIGRPTFKVLGNSKLDTILLLNSQVSKHYSNLNFDGRNCVNAIKMTGTRNCGFRNIRIEKAENGVTMVEGCWANVFDQCIWYNNTNGIYSIAAEWNLDTCNFFGCYFGANTYGIYANHMANCHFVGGWMEEHEACIKLILNNNNTMNTFQSVDFEVNKLILEAVPAETPVTANVNFMADGCSFVCSPETERRNTLVKHVANGRTLYCNFGLSDCTVDSGFRPIDGESTRTWLGIPHMTNTHTLYYATPNGCYVCPTWVSDGGFDYTVRGDLKTISDDGKKVVVDFGRWVYITGASIAAENVSIKDYYFYGIGASERTGGTTAAGKTSTTYSNAIRKLVFESTEDISNAEIVVQVGYRDEFI